MRLMLFSDILVNEQFELNGKVWVKLASNAAYVPGEKVPFVMFNEDYAVVAPDREPEKSATRYDIALGRKT